MELEVYRRQHHPCRVSGVCIGEVIKQVNRRKLNMVLALAVLVGGCGLWSDSLELLFDYFESGSGQVIEPSFDPSTISAGQIIFAGQLNTPVPCYRLVSDLDDNGSQLSMDIRATRSATVGCDTIVGRFIYSGAIRNLNPGTYSLRVRHIYDLPNWPAEEFSFSLTVR
jgi:hypothetical protein